MKIIHSLQRIKTSCTYKRLKAHFPTKFHFRFQLIGDRKCNSDSSNRTCRRRQPFFALYINVRLHYTAVPRVSCVALRHRVDVWTQLYWQVARRAAKRSRHSPACCKTATSLLTHLTCYLAGLRCQHTVSRTVVSSCLNESFNHFRLPVIHVHFSSSEQSRFVVFCTFYTSVLFPGNNSLNVVSLVRRKCYNNIRAFILYLGTRFAHSSAV